MKVKEQARKNGSTTDLHGSEESKSSYDSYNDFETDYDDSKYLSMNV